MSRQDPNKVDDERLLERMRRGDEAAFSQLFARHQGPIYRYALHMCGPGAADDVVQDTFLALIRQQQPTARTGAPAQGAPTFAQGYGGSTRSSHNMSASEGGERGEADPASDRAGVWGGAPRGFDPGRGSVGAYLFGIARHHVLKRLGDVYAATEIPVRVELAPPGGVGGSSPLAELERTEAVALVRDAVRSLPPAYREVIVLCELQEIDYADAAAMLECPIGTVRSRLHRGRALLTRKLASVKEDVAGVGSQ